MGRTLAVVKIVFLCLVALCIPGMLILDAVQARKYADLKQQVLDLEKKQADLVEQNKKLITDISVLSGTDRIERIAEGELGMRQAQSEEIIRVEMKDVKKK